MGVKMEENMTTIQNGCEEAGVGNSEYRSRKDRRKRPMQVILASSHVRSNNFEGPEEHGKVHAVQFKISPLVAREGEKVATLYNLSLSQFSKCLLYEHLGIFEPIDRRRKRRRSVKPKKLPLDDERGLSDA
jgi:hypothetical protein